MLREASPSRARTRLKLGEMSLISIWDGHGGFGIFIYRLKREGIGVPSPSFHGFGGRGVGNRNAARRASCQEEKQTHPRHLKRAITAPLAAQIVSLANYFWTARVLTFLKCFASLPPNSRWLFPRSNARPRAQEELWSSASLRFAKQLVQAPTMMGTGTTPSPPISIPPLEPLMGLQNPLYPGQENQRSKPPVHKMGTHFYLCSAPITALN